MKKLIALSLVALAACRGNDSRQPDPQLAADLALASQLAAAQPQIQFRDSAPAAEPAPAAKARTPQRAPVRIAAAPRTRVIPRHPVVSEPVVTPQPAADAPGLAPVPASVGRASIGAGATLSLASQQRICTGYNRPGDRFVATLTSPVSGAHGAVIPAGTPVVLRVVAVNSGAEPSIALAVHSLDVNGQSYPVSGDVYATSDLEKSRINPGSDRKKVIAGAVGGAILGRVMGKDTRGTVIGAAAGAATGAVVAKATEQYEGCLPVGAPVRLTLSEAVVL